MAQIEKGNPIRAYTELLARLNRLPAGGAYQASSRIPTSPQRQQLLRSMKERLAAAVAADPTEANPVFVPWQEWDAYCWVLNDRTGG